MKYILYCDFSKFMRNNKKMIIFYFLFMIIVLLLENFLGYPYQQNLFLNVMGLNFDMEGNYLTILTCFFNILFFLYISSTLFTNDLKTNVGNIFLRIKSNHYMFYKLLSIAGITLLIKGFMYIVVFVIFYLHHFMIEDILLYFLKDLFYIMVLQYGIILFYIMGTRMIKIVIAFAILLLLLMGKQLFNIIEMNLFILISLLLTFIPLINVLFQKYYILLFEEEIV